MDSYNAKTGKQGGETNSLIIVHPNHVFELRGFENAKEVRITGSFNNWSRFCVGEIGLFKPKKKMTS
ncbi:MAG: hypothetical protein ACI959_001908, partial [Limisphaerales bacterium]